MVTKGTTRRDRKRNQAWLARQLKVTQQRVSKLLRRDGWRWVKWGWTDAEVADIRTWLKSLREENPATSSADPEPAASTNGDDAEPLDDEVDPHELLKQVRKPDQRIKLMGVIERAAKVRVDRELLLGGYLKKEDVEAGRVARVQAVMAFFATIRSLAPQLEGMKAPEIERKLEAWAREGCMRFERGAI